MGFAWQPNGVPREQCRETQTDVKVLKNGTSELWRRAAGGETWRGGGEEMWTSAAGVEVCRSSPQELWRRAAGGGTWRGLPQERWRCAAGVASKEVWCAGALAYCCC